MPLDPMMELIDKATSPPVSRNTPCADTNLRYFDSGLLRICAHNDITIKLRSICSITTS
jgi:hypothetical protein